METDSEIIQMLKLADQDFKEVIINIFELNKTNIIREQLTGNLNREMETTFKRKFQTENTKSEVKNSPDDFNSRLEMAEVRI